MVRVASKRSGRGSEASMKDGRNHGSIVPIYLVRLCNLFQMKKKNLKKGSNGLTGKVCLWWSILIRCIDGVGVFISIDHEAS